MKLTKLLDHHGIATNPFAEEDAQTDPVFKEHCIASTYHPAWDKIYGDPREPSTSIVFGEKGAGKTAMRLQILQHLDRFNREHPGKRLFAVDYDDFNPFLDRFRETLSARRRRPDRVLSEWKLWDHMDSILSLAVTSLVDRILEVKQPSGVAGEVDPAAVEELDRHQARDLLLLAACYDSSTAETYKGRWHRLRRKLKYHTFKSLWDVALGWAVLVLTLGVCIFVEPRWLATPWPYLIAVAGWLPRLVRIVRWWFRARAVVRHMRVGNHEANPLRQVLMHFTAAEIASQPLPNKDRTDDRFEMVCKLQGLLKTLGFSGILVLVDRVDEPHLINGSAEQMKAFLWPLLDNKFLKHPGLGFKLLLPIELATYLEREEREFYQRARLDKQNMIPSLEWSGESLFDVANDRVKACAIDGASPNLQSLFEEGVSEHRLIETFRTLRVPRHLFKFLNRLLIAHCNAHTEEQPVWEIPRELFEAQFALFMRDQDAVDRGVRAG
ncbi:MAG: hypothetical protein WD030_00620 [Pirellulales bacterium]